MDDAGYDASQNENMAPNGEFGPDRRMMQLQQPVLDGVLQDNDMNSEKSDDDSGDEENDTVDFDLLTKAYGIQQKLAEKKEQPDVERARLSGVGQMLKELRGEYRPPQKERIVLDRFGLPIRDPSKFPVCRLEEVQQTLALGGHQDSIDLRYQNAPTDVRVARKMFRQKMIRCKSCRSRFIERFVYEGHLKDKHPDLYVKFIQEQEEEAELQRLEEIERNRIEELETGGFIPPENEISQPSEDANLIPLPGENSDGYVPKFDHFGRIVRKAPYRKKISPQCPFCDKRFRNELSLKKHFLKKHEEATDIKQCLKCFKCAENGDALAAHQCELTYVCFECTPLRNMCTDYRLNNHRKKFHRGKGSGFRCAECNHNFLTPRKLRKHVKMAHVFTKPIQCHFCEEYFHSENAVMKHERVHTGIIKFECKVCDFRANRFNAMEEHTKKEHGYVCAICQERQSEYLDLKHHVYEKHYGYMAADEPVAYIEPPRMWMLFKGE